MKFPTVEGLPEMRIFRVSPSQITSNPSNFGDPVLAFPSLGLSRDRAIQVFFNGFNYKEQQKPNCEYGKWAWDLRKDAPKRQRAAYKNNVFALKEKLHEPHQLPGPLNERNFNLSATLLPGPVNFPEMFATEALFIGNQSDNRDVRVQWEGKEVIRPLIIKELGEVFWGNFYMTDEHLCEDFDMIFYRSKTFLNPRCTYLWFTPGMLQDNNQGYHLDSLKQKPLSYEAALAVTKKKKATPCMGTFMSTFKDSLYMPDALVRHAFMRMLEETAGVKCDIGGKAEGYVNHAAHFIEAPPTWNEENTTSHYAPYKFNIAMENQLDHGYMTEKIFNPMLAGSTPVYFGAPDIAKYVNPRRFIHCDISETSIVKMRTGPTTTGERWMRVPEEEQNMTHQEMINFAKNTLEEELRPCVTKMVEYANDDTAYAKMLTEPAFSSESQKLFSKHAYVAEALLEAMTFLGRRDVPHETLSV